VTSPHDPVAAKAALRAQFLDRRRARPAPEAAAAAAAVTTRTAAAQVAAMAQARRAAWSPGSARATTY